MRFGIFDHLDDKRLAARKHFAVLLRLSLARDSGVTEAGGPARSGRRAPR